MKKTVSQIQNSKSVLLLGHVSPDGDTSGCLVALCLALNSIGKDAVAAFDGSLAEKYDFLGNYIKFHDYDEVKNRKFDLVIALDVAEPGRLGRFKEYFINHINSIQIDHHVSNEHFANINYVKEASATGELVLELIESLGANITVEIANSLYTAISTDTGNFAYDNVSEATFLAAAKLRAAGASTAWLCDRIYKNRPLAATVLIGKAIDSLQLYHGGKLAIMHISGADMYSCGASVEHCDGLVNYAKEISGVDVAILLREKKDGGYKASLRSEMADVCKVAAEFGGGGHVQAAGCNIDLPLEDAVCALVNLCK